MSRPRTCPHSDKSRIVRPDGRGTRCRICERTKQRARRAAAGVVAKRSVIRCPCCGLLGWRVGSGIIGGAAGAYHAAEAKLIATMLSRRYSGLNPAGRQFAQRFGATVEASTRLMNRARAGDAGERTLDKLRVMIGWLAPYQYSEEARSKVIHGRMHLAKIVELYEDPLFGYSGVARRAS